MAKRTKAQLKTKVDQIIKPNGNREITPEKHNSIETDIIDSFLNAADGGFVIDQAAGYSTEVAITDDRQFASKKYVDDNSGGGASSFAELSGDPYDNSALGEALNEKQDTISSTDEITEGATNLYFTEERVLGALLDAVIPEDSVIEEGDTIQEFANKAQGQIDNKEPKLPSGGPNTFLRSDKTFVALPVLSLHPYTQLYLTRIANSGGKIDSATINAVDEFFTTGEKDGWLTDIFWAWCPLGSNLAAALCNLITSGSIPDNLTNNNFVESDYSQSKGFGTGATFNSTKYLSGIVNPSTITNVRDISFGVIQTSFDPMGGSGGSYAFGLTPDTGTTTLFVGNSNAGFFPSFYQEDHYGEGMRMCTSRNDGIDIIWDCFTARNSATPISSGIDINAELNIFRTRFGGNLVCSAGKMGFAFLGKGLSNAKARSLSRAAFTLNYKSGRFLQFGGRSAYFGDSNTSGRGVTLRQRWSYIVSQQLGQYEYNAGSSSSQLRQTVAAATGGYQRYLEIDDVSVNTVMSMYGTNDMLTADATTNGDSSILNDFEAKYNTMCAYWLSRGFQTIIIGVPASLTGANATKHEMYVARCANVAKANNVPFVDIYRAMLDTGSVSTYLQWDNLHLNALGHRLLADLVLARIAGRSYRKPVIEFSEIEAGDSQVITLVMLTANIGNPVSISVFEPVDGIVFEAWVSDADTVSVKATNKTGAPIDPGSVKALITLFH